MAEQLLTVNDLQVEFQTESGVVHAVDGVSFSMAAGEILGLVGESGCGKSVTALSLVRLIPSPPGRIAAGAINWRGRDLLRLPVSELVKLRGAEIGMIFQEPLTSFNPVQRIGAQLGEVLKAHTDLSEAEIRDKVAAGLRRVGLPEPERQYAAYPHELSGGMRQRAMIAMALACQPQLVIADEPTTALDVTIQAQVLELLQELQAENGMAVLLITHNLGIVAEIAQRVAVMYAGKIVELAPVRELFHRPLHPYTVGLLRSIPTPTGTGALYAIPGQVPDPYRLPPGCYFAPRCPQAQPICHERRPELQMAGDGHTVACWMQSN
ncbi:MAG: ABC transporter ATP-binding protein [Bacillota bacterium]|jgi:oligopeptide/dipeptide ABC transporter ATP-binding protein